MTTQIRPIPPAQMTPDLLDDPQAASLLNVQPRTLRLWRNTRGLPHLKITSKVIRYRRSDLERWLDQHRVAISG